MTWKIELDRSWEREGFDPASLASAEIEVSASERFVAEAILIAVLGYVGGRVLDKLTDKGIDATLGELVKFAQSREKRLLIELHETGADPRVRLVAVKIESMKAAEFKTAIAALPRLRVRIDRLLDAAPTDLADVWYVWDEDAGDWTFTYYTTKGGDFVEDEPGAANRGGSASS